MSRFLEKFHPKVTIPALGGVLGATHASPVSLLHLVAGNLFGGIERMLLSLGLNAHYCPTLKHSFGVCFPGRLAEELRSKNLGIQVFGKASFRNPFSLLFSRNKFRGFLDNKHFDWIVCHGSWIHALFGGIIRKSGSKFGHMIHGISNDLSRQDRWSQNNPPDMLLANSHCTVATANRLFPGVPTSVVYPACDLQPPADPTNLRNIWRRYHGATPEKFVVYAASRIEAGKGLDILIDALGLLKQNPYWVCWIGGEPQRRSDFDHLKALKSIALRAGVESRIKWIGHVGDMPGHFAAADVYCQPNRLPESFGMTFIEAQAMGCPVITTGFGGALEVVEDNGINTLLAKPCPDLLAKALEKHLLIPSRHAAP